MPPFMAWPPSATSMDPRGSSRFINVTPSLLVALAFLFVSHTPACYGSITDDAAALLAFKASVPGANKFTSWSNATVSTICSNWEGVTCNNQSARVINLRLPGDGLSGTIPSGIIGKLDALQVLSLRKNNFSGTFPSDLANCTSLQQLILSNNRFSGSLPNFSAWPELRRLDLSNNLFSGQIPSSLNNLTHIRMIFLENNSLTGNIPSLAAIAQSLANFSVANNNLSGPIPTELSTFPTEDFAGNNGLCGHPLLLSCTGTPVPTGNSTSSSSKLSSGAIAAIVIGCLAAIAVLALCVALICLKRSRSKDNDRDKDLYGGGRKDFENGLKGADSKPRTQLSSAARYDDGSTTATVAVPNTKLTFVGGYQESFDLEELLRASAEVLGKGTLGTTYKAVLSDGLFLTVKRLRESGDAQQQQQRQDALSRISATLGSLQHPNIVPHIAYFFAQSEKLLISEYMPNGSLSAVLHGNKGLVRGVLDWETRLKIAAGVAKGLVYLHSKKVMHGHLKSSNVLLDSEDQPRLSDYGLAQLTNPHQASSSTLSTVKKPTNAYAPADMAATDGAPTYKSDVYSFGVMLLELLTGKSPTALLLQEGIHLPTWVMQNPQKEEVLDQRILKHDYIHDDMITLLNIALPCVSPSPDRRPHMVEVVRQIDNLVNASSHGDDGHFDIENIHDNDV